MVVDGGQGVDQGGQLAAGQGAGVGQGTGGVGGDEVQPVVPGPGQQGGVDLQAGHRAAQEELLDVVGVDGGPPGPVDPHLLGAVGSQGLGGDAGGLGLARPRGPGHDDRPAPARALLLGTGHVGVDDGRLQLVPERPLLRLAGQGVGWCQAVKDGLDLGGDSLQDLPVVAGVLAAPGAPAALAAPGVLAARCHVGFQSFSQGMGSSGGLGMGSVIASSSSYSWSDR
ncbi:hypothetical protein [Actinomyces wuliandei]|uniref:hypothetical protein n=1 Tax=Actinomyces wuliandei TaxID=2057743 RepID=UPI0013E36EEF|nr:hypothetical protein [Actinomyces wuliandei]